MVEWQSPARKPTLHSAGFLVGAFFTGRLRNPALDLKSHPTKKDINPPLKSCGFSTSAAASHGRRVHPKITATLRY